MATKLEKPVTREVPVKDSEGCDGDVLVTITADGVTLRGKGTQRDIKIGWLELAATAPANPKMPTKYSDNKLGWLINKKKDESSSD